MSERSIDSKEKSRSASSKYRGNVDFLNFFQTPIVKKKGICFEN